MTIKTNFLLRQVAGSWIVVAVNEACVDFNGMLTLNESGAFLWEQLEQGAEPSQLTAALLQQYDVTAETAEKDVQSFLQTLRKAGCLQEP